MPEVDGHQYIVAIKWWSRPVDIDATVPTTGVNLQLGRRVGLFISASGCTKPAVDECVRALRSRVILLVELTELVLLLEQEGDITA